MEILTIEIKSSKVYKLLKSLEALNLIRVLKTDKQPSRKLSKKYASSIPGNVTDELQSQVAESRASWGA
ncbi:hypothetical protein FJ651_06890 [Paucihalobacter ruber]|jgi:hypothetical protein|uniref:Uncharacterized protein n=1 Tax=Paucihalobacter ruber TaxID=2567861 RepID=A0A506PNZ8_9FLAO|nr:hypothetical protein [Paucihalobacter ruber]TPV33880.1 hypothetical protein FJ651_06890 [Paucihalobacter ruber]